MKIIGHYFLRLILSKLNTRTLPWFAMPLLAFLAITAFNTSAFRLAEDLPSPEPEFINFETAH